MLLNQQEHSLDKNMFQICLPPKNMFYLQRNHSLYYECFCGIKRTQSQCLYKHFRYKHLNECFQSDNHLGQSYFMFYFKHAEKQLFIGKIQTIGSIELNKELKKYYEQKYTRCVNLYLFKNKQHQQTSYINSIEQNYQQTDYNKIQKLELYKNCRQKIKNIKYRCFCGSINSYKHKIIQHFKLHCIGQYQNEKYIYFKSFKHNKSNFYLICGYFRNMLTQEQKLTSNTKLIRLIRYNKPFKSNKQINSSVSHFQMIQLTIPLNYVEIPKIKKIDKFMEIKFQCICGYVCRHKCNLITHLRKMYQKQKFEDQNIYLKYYKKQNQSKYLIRPYFVSKLTEEQLKKYSYQIISLKDKKRKAKNIKKYNEFQTEIVDQQFKQSQHQQNNQNRARLQWFTKENAAFVDVVFTQKDKILSQCVCGNLFHYKNTLINHLRRRCKMIDLRESVFVKTLKNNNQQKYMVKAYFRHQLSQDEINNKQQVNLRGMKNRQRKIPNKRIGFDITCQQQSELHVKQQFVKEQKIQKLEFVKQEENQERKPQSFTTGNYQLVKFEEDIFQEMQIVKEQFYYDEDDSEDTSTEFY